MKLKTSSPRTISPYEYKDLDPNTVYEIVTPMFGAAAQERLHSQITDKAFELKSRLALIGFMQRKLMSYNEMDHVVKKRDALERIFEVEEYLILLECKHCVTGAWVQSFI